MNTETVIKLNDITKIYDTGVVQVKALSDVRTEIKKGEFVSIMGPSGSGKSTLMNIISCLDKPTSGEYILKDKDVSKLNSDQLARVRNKTVGIVFQSFNLLSRTTAQENVELPLLYDPEKEYKERKRISMAALEEVGLKDWWHHHPNQLSGGQQQRVAIARAIVNEPEILLADEPTGNLDSKTSIEIMELLQELNEDKGITVIMITHEDDISKYSDRVLNFIDGELVSDKPVKKRTDATEVLKKWNNKKGGK